MARNRMIKPEFYADEKLSRASIPARFVFPGLWIQADDYGVVRGNPVFLKNTILPYDTVAPDEFAGWLTELENIGAIIPFEANGERFYWIRNFLKHQSINKPSKWKRNPPPPPDVCPEYWQLFDDVPEGYRKATGGLPDERKGKGKEKKRKGKGKEREGDSKGETHCPDGATLFPNGNKNGLYRLADELKESGIFKNARSFVTRMLNTHKHPLAIEQALTQAQRKGKMMKPGGAWAYCMKIVDVESGNYNARESGQ